MAGSDERQVSPCFKLKGRKYIGYVSIANPTRILATSQGPGQGSRLSRGSDDHTEPAIVVGDSGAFVERPIGLGRDEQNFSPGAALRTLVLPDHT